MQVPIRLIEWNIGENPRKTIDTDNLSSLKRSIVAVHREKESDNRRGLLEAIGIVPKWKWKTIEEMAEAKDIAERTVRSWSRKDDKNIERVEFPDGVKYTEVKDEKPFKVAYGWRRLKAMRELADTYVWAETIEARIEYDAFDKDAHMSFAIIENVQREDMEAIEEAEALQDFIEQSDDDMSQRDIAEMIGKSKGWVAQRLKILSMPPDVRERVEQKELPISHVRQLGRLKEEEAQHRILDFIEHKDPTYDEIKDAVEAHRLDTDSSGADKSSSSDSDESSGQTDTKTDESTSEPDADDSQVDVPNESDGQTDDTVNVQGDDGTDISTMIENINIQLDAFEKRKGVMDDDQMKRERVSLYSALAALHEVQGSFKGSFPFPTDDERDRFIENPEEYIE